MSKTWLAGLVVIGLFAVLLGGYFWYTNQNPSTMSAEEYIDTGFANLDAPDSQSQPTETTTEPASPTPEIVSNPPMTSGTTITELESDLNQTTIEEEIFTDL